MGASYSGSDTRSPGIRGNEENLTFECYNYHSKSIFTSVRFAIEVVFLNRIAITVTRTKPIKFNLRCKIHISHIYCPKGIFYSIELTGGNASALARGCGQSSYKRSEQVKMLLSPLCLLGLSLVSPSVVVELCVDYFLQINEETNNDSGCFFGEVRALDITDMPNHICELISGASVMTSSIMVSEMKRMRNGLSVILYMFEHLTTSKRSTFTIESAFKDGM
ncbi:hypothetical protein YC2023_018862 [Brassica napus]